jgi:plasmid stabilization system protein ParE
MKVEFNALFEETLVSILNYIMIDSIDASISFEEEIFEYLDDLTHFPFKFRKSRYYDDEHIRDYIFKGYTIPYLIDEEKDVIVVLDIFKWTDR